ncbi:hypothetical protein DMN91_009382 [Ooceraea biroi]|uniref:Peptidase A2 domain-containing protein n=1 Tax=Ooceraea biroi TaxID=2015173 RepID=A0A3L8DF49_OOCBI|nr:uncharacterized protein LOC105276782 [Ooceraea biroi]RLU19024.1 hypothetical protein DMN91_009382 [Ooceraea biroi]
MSPEDTWSYFLMHFISRRLDRETLEAWEIHLRNATDPASFDQLEKFLDGRIRALELSGPQPATRSKQAQSAKSSSSTSKSKPARSHVASVKATTCSCCSASHFIASCPDFARKSLSERRDFVRSKRLCFNCLGEHLLTDCRTAKRCRTCNERHHTLIHPDRSLSSSSELPPSAAPPPSNSTQSNASLTRFSTQRPPSAFSSAATALLHCATSANEASRPITLLATALVNLEAASGQVVKARALLDQGSELSFIGESLAQSLRLPRRNATVSVLGIGSQRAGSTRGAVVFTLYSRTDPSFKCPVTAYILPRLTRLIPVSPVNTTSWSHLHGIDLADPDYATPGRVDIILGADTYGIFVRDSVRRGSPDVPVAQSTSLGWIVSGPAPDSRAIISSSFSSVTAAVDHELHELLARFWHQEEIKPSIESRRTPAEEECEAHFASTHSRTPCGRYVVRLPFHSSPNTLGDSRAAAVRMLQKVQRRIASDATFGKLYADFLREYESLGHMVRAPPATKSAAYLPHHGVLRESSTTTKLRVVFNGSLPTTTGKSLNDCLHIGPKLQRDLSDVLMRWRRHAYVFLADVEKMFRQILVHPDDRDHQRILWSESGDPSEFLLCTVAFGLACSPFIALKVFLQLASDEGDRFPLAADVVRSDMYVDDVLSGGDTIPLAKAKARELTQLCMAGGFPLQKWMANDSAILSEVPASKLGFTQSRTFEEDNLACALGLAWNPSSDAFEFQIQLSQLPHPLSKRTVLSLIARMFDPLGWITPITITGKIILQQLWKCKLDWDDPLPPALTRICSNFQQSLSSVARLSVPRWIGLSASALAVEVHGFSDASQDALGAVVYIRVFSELDDVRVTLLMAKSKVAPLAKQTIPRLELTAAVLLTRLVVRARSTLNIDDAPVHLWTDSSVVLAWIRGHPSQWKEYVANRVALIQELLPHARWHHVPGTENPADCASRGLPPQLLATHDTWWHGPAWLARPSTSWPTKSPPVEQTIDLEIRPARAHASTASVEPTWELLAKYSSLRRLVRITTWIRLSVERFRQQRLHCAAPTPLDLSSAETFWIKVTQQAHFHSELEALSRNAELPRSHPFLRLAPFLDNCGILRVGGRLRNSLLEPEAKHPVLLPRNSRLSTLILDDIHQRTLHGGVQVMLATLRQRFWILGGRTPVAAFARRCARCARYRASTVRQLMGQLPACRVTQARPFLHTGVDYAGPFTVKTWRGRAARSYKGFLVVFVCLSASAVHLELATDYSTQGFLAAYRRFTSRRGICAVLRSDRGTNLVGADAELRRLFNSASNEAMDLAHTLASSDTEWRFNPPGAPHFGAQIEAVLNSRPLSPLSDDPSDIEALTPAHFLIGEPLSSLPEPSTDDIPQARLSRWQLLQKVRDQFWRRWSSEYLQRLQDLSKWQRPVKSLGVGSLVLLADERYPPSRWPLARVTEVHPGQDGLVRVATVKTQSSTLKRPIVKLCPLPIDTDDSN